MTLGQPGGRIASQLAGALFCLALANTARCESAGDDLSWQFTVHQLEWQQSSGADAMAWDASGWVGTARNRLWIRDEGGRHVDGVVVDNRLELLWGHPVKYWEWLVGVRQDDGTAPSRTYFALGIQAMAPFGIHVESTGYLGEGSRFGDDIHVGYRLMAERDWTLASRFTLGARAEYELWSEDHVRYSEGHGPSGVFASLRLRYELDDQIQPNLGVEWFRLVGDTGDLARLAGESQEETRLIAGLRLRF